MDACPKCGAFVEISDNYCGQCRFELAEEKMTPLLTHQQINVDDVRTRLAHVYFKMGKYKEALIIFENNLKLNPDNDHTKQMIEIIKEKL